MASTADFVSELVLAKQACRGEFTLEQIAQSRREDLPPPANKGTHRAVAALLSPRSIEACLREGVNPVSLLKRDVSSFAGPGVGPAEQKLRADMYEELRTESLRAVTESRAALPAPARSSGPGSSTLGEPSGQMTAGPRSSSPEQHAEMFENEERALQVMKRRQAREMETLLRAEETRAEMEEMQTAKVKREQRRALELKRRQERKEAEWRASQQKLALQRKAKEEAAELAARAEANKRHEEEAKLVVARKAKERKAQRARFLKGQEEAARAAKFRAQTERFIEMQIQELEQKSKQIAIRDAERRAALEEQRKKRARKQMAERQRALRRQQKAREAAQEVLVKRRAAFSAQQDTLKKRLDDLERKRAADEVRMRLEAERNAERRMAAIAEAKREEEKRIEAIVAKKRRQDERLAAAYDKRKFEAAQKNAQRTIKQSLRTSKVEAMQRASEYKRAMLRSRLQEQEQRVDDMLEQRFAMQNRRRLQNQQADMQKAKMRDLLDRLQSTNITWSDLSQTTGGDMSMEALERAVTKKKGSAGTL